MMNRANNESGAFNMAALALLAIAICAVALILMPAQAKTDVPATAYSAASDYLPAQIANRATEVEPMPEMYY
jgi:hypothetical protein